MRGITWITSPLALTSRGNLRCEKEVFTELQNQGKTYKTKEYQKQSNPQKTLKINNKSEEQTINKIKSTRKQRLNKSPTKK